VLRDLFALIAEVSSYQWSGKIAIANPVAGLSWQLYFAMGHLAWVDGSIHPRHRYRRHFKALGLVPSLSECRTPEARLQLIISAIQDRRISAEGFQRFLQASAREIFFDMSQACSTSLHRDEHGRFNWHKNVRPSQDFILPPTWGVKASTAFKQGRHDWQQWGKTRLTHYSPDMSPVILNKADLVAQLPPYAADRIVKLFSGKRTLRDVARQTKWHIYEVATFVRPLLRNGCLRLDAKPDYGDRQPMAAFDYLRVNGLELTDTAMAMYDDEGWMSESMNDADMRETIHDGGRALVS